MKKNLGNSDKAIRIAIASVVVVLAIAKVITGVLAIVLLLVSAILLITSLISFCPVYWPFGVSTRRKFNTKS